MKLFFIIVAAVVCGLLIFVHPLLCIAAFIALGLVCFVLFKVADYRTLKNARKMINTSSDIAWLNGVAENPGNMRAAQQAARRRAAMVAETSKNG